MWVLFWQERVSLDDEGFRHELRDRWRVCPDWAVLQGQLKNLKHDPDLCLSHVYVVPADQTADGAYALDHIRELDNLARSASEPNDDMVPVSREWMKNVSNWIDYLIQWSDDRKGHVIVDEENAKGVLGHIRRVFERMGAHPTEF